MKLDLNDFLRVFPAQREKFLAFLIRILLVTDYSYARRQRTG